MERSYGALGGTEHDLCCAVLIRASIDGGGVPSEPEDMEEEYEGEEQLATVTVTVVQDLDLSALRGRSRRDGAA